VVRAEDVLDFPDQHGDIVSDTALAELPEVRQISPDLSRVDIRESRQANRGNGMTAFVSQVEQDVEV
jgi:hypothetical protein